MSSKKRRHADDSTDDEDIMRASTATEETVDVDFEIFEPNERFTKGVRVQLQTFCSQLKLDVFEVTDCIIDQVNIGSIICVPDEDNELSGANTVLGVVSLLNLKQHEKQFKGMVKFLKAKLDKSGSGILKAVCEHPERTGILVTGRIANVPDTIVASAFEGIPADIDWSIKAEDCPDDEREFYKFNTVIGFSIVYKEGNNRSKKHKSPSNEMSTSQMEYLHDESSIIRKMADSIVDIPTGKSVKSNDGKCRFDEYCMVYMMSYSKFCQVGNALQTASKD